MASSLAAIGILAVTAYVCMSKTRNSLSLLEANTLAGQSASDTAVHMVEEPSNIAIDPTLWRSDPNRHPVQYVEPGPFGVPRYIQHDVGKTWFPSHGPWGPPDRPGFHTG